MALPKGEQQPLLIPTARARHNTLIVKLFLVILGAVALTYFAFSGFYRSFWNTSNRPEALPHVMYYWELLSDHLGTPPDTALAASLSRRLGFAISISGPDLEWRSANYLRGVTSELKTHPGPIPSTLRDGRFWAGIRRGEYFFVYGTRRRAPQSILDDWMTLLPVLALSCLLAWLLLRHILRPLRNLEDGVHSVAAGNLDVRLPVKGKDELAGLAQSFNAMAKGLKDRDRARDQLLLDVSHELRSPLTRMRVALEMAEPTPLITHVREEVEALGKMVSEILETERLKSAAGAVKRKPEDLSELISEKVSRFAGEKPGIRWTPVEFPPVPLDSERMRLVLRNLIENAIKYGKDAAEPIDITLTQEGPCAVLRVRDHGVGVEEADQAIIFEPFYRLDRSRSRASGYGLGLPLCKRIVEAHGGTISLSGRPGEGTTVTVKLPMT